MDPRRFDQFSTAMAHTNTRRGLLRRLAIVPILGGLIALFDASQGEGKGRHRRRVKRHKHGKGRRRQHKSHPRKKRCTAQPLEQTCAGKCGEVTNSCQQAVDCGACPAGLVCCGNGCVDLNTNANHCGDCQTACSETRPICFRGACVPCAAPMTCPNGGCCADDGSCQPCGG